jgi:molybdate transport system substrate-binding protein
MAAALALAAAGTMVQAQTETELRVYAAGSLRAALTEVAQAFERSEPGVRVRFTFGASGLLRDRIAGGERADVFASANMEHPQALASTGHAGSVRRFTRNAMCALVAPSVDVTPETLVDRLLDPSIKIGTSTPKADPSGDYAWMVFERIEQPGRRSVAVPTAINVSADYGVVPLQGAAPQSQRFIEFLLGPNAQAIFARNGFAPA